jgi:hypothetical protein
MLKIKDDVDLKDLYKYGFDREFKYLDALKMYVYIKEIDIGGNKESIVVYGDRIIQVNGTRILNILYDLIQTQLVEKVEG